MQSKKSPIPPSAIHWHLNQLKSTRNIKAKGFSEAYFKSSTGKVLNADINGALNIVLKYLTKLKVADESFVKGIVGRGLFARPHIITFYGELFLMKCFRSTIDWNRAYILTQNINNIKKELL